MAQCRRRLKIVGIWLLALFLVLVIRLMSSSNNHSDFSSKTTESSVGVTAVPESVVREQSDDQPEDGLLELELIGYANAIKSFSSITIDDFLVKINDKERFFLFVGRPTCEWCRKIAPALQNTFSELNVSLYYLDSTHTETNETLRNFRYSFGITEVPAVLMFENGAARQLEIDLMGDDIYNNVYTTVKRELAQHDLDP